MSNEFYIREVDEYSEETHSDDMFQSRKVKKNQNEIANSFVTSTNE